MSQNNGTLKLNQKVGAGAMLDHRPQPQHKHYTWRNGGLGGSVQSYKEFRNMPISKPLFFSFLKGKIIHMYLSFFLNYKALKI